MIQPVSKSERFSLGIFLLFQLFIFYFLMKPFIMLILLAATIVILSYKPYEYLNRLFKDRRRLSALLMTFLVFLILIWPLALLGTIFFDQIFTLLKDLNLRETFAQFYASEFYKGFLEPMFLRIEGYFGTKIDLLGYLNQFLKEAAITLSKYSPKVVLSTAHYLFAFFVMMITIFFLYVEGPKLFRLLLDISPMRDAHELQLVGQFKTTVRATLWGTLVTSFIQAILATIGYLICQVPIAFLLGVVTFFVSMIPFIGTAGVWVPVCIWLFFSGKVGYGIFLLIYGLLVVGLVDNIVKPLFIRGRNKNHPLLIFFSLLGGIALMGPFGIIFGPVITASLIATISIYREEVVKNQQAVEG